MRHITVVVRELNETKDTLKYGDITKEQSKALKRRLFELKKEIQTINWS